MFSSNRWEGLRPSQGWCWLIHLSTLTKSVCLEIKSDWTGPEYGFGIGAICTCSLNRSTPAVVSPHPQVRFPNDFRGKNSNPYTPSQPIHLHSIVMKPFPMQNETRESDFTNKQQRVFFRDVERTHPGPAGHRIIRIRHGYRRSCKLQWSDAWTKSHVYDHAIDAGDRYWKKQMSKIDIENGGLEKVTHLKSGDFGSPCWISGGVSWSIL